MILSCWTPRPRRRRWILEAPGRVLDLMDERGLRLILKPSLAAGRASLRLFRLSERYLIRRLSHMAGAAMLSELSEFFTLFEGMYEKLSERTRAFQKILASSQSAFVIVSTASAHALGEAQKLAQRLQDDQLKLAALIVNQRHQPIDALSSDELQRLLAAGHKTPQAMQDLAQAMDLACRDANLRAKDEATSIEKTMRLLPDCPLYQIARQDRDVHDLKALARIGQQLTGAGRDAQGGKNGFR